MPLTDKGKKIMGAMEAKYGKNKPNDFLGLFNFPSENSKNGKKKNKKKISQFIF